MSLSEETIAELIFLVYLSNNATCTRIYLSNAAFFFLFVNVPVLPFNTICNVIDYVIRLWRGANVMH